jgi:hypothetical protein
MQGEDVHQSHWTDYDGNVLSDRGLAAQSAAAADPYEPSDNGFPHGRSRRRFGPAAGGLLLSQLSWEDMGLYTCTYTRQSSQLLSLKILPNKIKGGRFKMRAGGEINC